MTDLPEYVDILVTVIDGCAKRLAKAPGWSRIGVGDQVTFEGEDLRREVLGVATIAADSEILKLLEEYTTIWTVEAAWKQSQIYPKESE